MVTRTAKERQMRKSLSRDHGDVGGNSSVEFEDSCSGKALA